MTGLSPVRDKILSLSPIAGAFGYIYDVVAMDAACNHPLCRHRQANRLTRACLASQIGCSTRSLARWEQGVTRPRMELAVRVSKVTGLSLDALFGGAEASSMN
jgi:DNA-binding XRE family transcriptional regulator